MSIVFRQLFSSSLLKGWRFSSSYVQGLLGGLVTRYNEIFEVSNTCFLHAGIVLEGKNKESDKVLILVNVYAPYSDKISFGSPQ